MIVVIGTRPGIVKMAPVFHAAAQRGLNVKLLHTGQHYSYSMDRAIMEDVDLPEPHFQIAIPDDERTHARQTARMLVGVEDILLEEKPSAILVCGDANTNFAAAVAARKLHVSVGHVEAGLRSRDWKMPEEHNRVMIDHISDFLFAPTKECSENLRTENVSGQIHVVGNTIVDATLRAEKIANGTRNTNLEHLERDGYVLLTAHREENVDNKAKCESFIEFLKSIKKTIGKTIVFPMHPRTEMRFKEFGFYEVVMNLVQIVPPVQYLDFIHLISNAHIVLTDSGGIQEESCILGVPCFTLRENTERWETVQVGANVICGFDMERFMSGYESRSLEWTNPFGDGSSSRKIIDVVATECGLGS